MSCGKAGDYLRQAVAKPVDRSQVQPLGYRDSHRGGSLFRVEKLIVPLDILLDVKPERPVALRVIQHNNDRVRLHRPISNMPGFQPNGNGLSVFRNCEPVRSLELDPEFAKIMGTEKLMTEKWKSIAMLPMFSSFFCH
jgi:hypothetical protein